MVERNKNINISHLRMPEETMEERRLTTNTEVVSRLRLPEDTLEERRLIPTKEERLPVETMEGKKHLQLVVELQKQQSLLLLRSLDCMK